ncbi:MAG: polyhydroxybutyrate depolymerase, partial [Crocinitomicaceae bacterium]
TVDATVPYAGAIWTRSIDDVLAYWVGHNNTNPVPTTTPLPDLNGTDGSTVEHIVYDGGDEGVTVEHMKITGGGHTWPGNVFGGAGTNYDINASLEIWKFFMRYEINGFIGITETVNEFEISVYPNPTSDFVTIKISPNLMMSEYIITDNAGRTVGMGSVNELSTSIDLSTYANGAYLLRIGNQAMPVRINKH